MPSTERQPLTDEERFWRQYRYAVHVSIWLVVGAVVGEVLRVIW